MAPDRFNRLSNSSDNDVSHDSGFGSLIPSRRSRTPSPPGGINKAAQILDENKWREAYRRHNESGIASAQSATV